MWGPLGCYLELVARLSHLGLTMGLIGLTELTVIGLMMGLKIGLNLELPAGVTLSVPPLSVPLLVVLPSTSAGPRPLCSVQPPLSTWPHHQASMGLIWLAGA